MYTNTMRMTGLSGIDTDSMVKQLMTAESVKMNSLKQNRQKLEWKQESYRSVASSMKTFQDSFLSVSATAEKSLRLNSTFLNLSGTVKISGGEDTTAVSAKASGSAVAGTYSLEVESVAKKDIYVSNSKIDTAIKGNEETGLQGSFNEGETFNIALDGKSVAIEIDANLSALSKTDTNAFVAKLNEKLKSSFGTDKLANGDLVNKVSVNTTGGVFNLAVNGQGHVASVSQKADAGTLEKFGFKSGQSTAINKSKSIAEALGVTGTAKFKINGVDFSFDESDSLQKVFDDINNSKAGVTVSFSDFSGEFKLESKESGTKGKIDITDTSGFFKDNLKIDTTAEKKSTATDAVFKFNGVSTSRDSNNFTIDGITISLTEEAEKIGKPIEIKLKEENTKTFDTLKSFVDEYNKLIGSLNTQINTNRPKSGGYSFYEPLTDEERKALPDKEAEAWDAKAKTGMLYRDSLVTDITRELRSMMNERVQMKDGSSLSLFDIGITTTNKASDGGKLQIDEEKLKKAIAERGADVAELFTRRSEIPATDKSKYSARLKDEGIADRLNDIVNKAISTNGTIYKKAGIIGTGSETTSDMYKELKSQDSKISDMLRALAQKETNYFQMFSKLESAMNSSNSQMSSLQAMLGG